MRISSRIACGSLALLVLLAGLSPAAAEGSTVIVDLGLAQEFYYENDPMAVQISVRNVGSEKTVNPIRSPLLSGFRVRKVGGEKIEATGKPTAEEPARPDQLTPGGFYGTVIDLTQLFPELRKGGAYEVYWSGHGIHSSMLVVSIIPRFDPTKSYTAEIQTSLGTIVVGFLGEKAPIAVKSFVDMARVGFYGGMQFHEAYPDSHIIGGDPVFSEQPRRSITFPAELPTIPLVAGTMVFKPVSAAPPANGSTFMILLKPQPTWTGQVTVFGQVIKGLDVVRKISQVKTSGRTSRPYFKPLEPVMIEQITISEADRPAPAPS